MLSTVVVPLPTTRSTRPSALKSPAATAPAAEKPAAIGQTINLGSNREITIGDLAQLIIRTVGVPAEIESDAARIRPANSEVERLLADNTRAKKLLGWEPRISLEEGLQQTIEWLRKNQHWYRAGIYAQ